MSQNFDFTRFVPGFDFLKSLTPAAGAQQGASKWVAPTLDPAELEKRIAELKTVHFWLDQNTKAVGATIQALEVQRMTLATLKEMNVSFSEMAESFKLKPTPAQPEAAEAPQATPDSAQATSTEETASNAPVNPAQWWGALTQQFQHIANQTMTDLAKNAAVHEQMSAAKAKDTTPRKAPASKSATAAPAAKKAPTKKSASSTRTRKTTASR